MDDIKDKISEKLEEAIEVYSEKTVLRAILCAIPYIGSSLDVLLSSRGQKIFNDRIMFLLEQLREDMSSVEEDVIDQNFLESDEWFDLIVKAFDSAIRTRDQEKIKLYSKILRNSVIQSVREEHNPEDYLTVLTELTSSEVRVARVLYKQQNDKPTEDENELQWAKRKGWENLASECELDEKDLDFLLKRLEKAD